MKSPLTVPLSAKQTQHRGVNLNLSRVGVGGTASLPGSPARELNRLVQLQRDKLQALESHLLGCEAELQDWEEVTGHSSDVGALTLKTKQNKTSNKLLFKAGLLSLLIRKPTWRTSCCF